MKKKLLSFLLAATMLFSLTACGGEEVTEAPAEATEETAETTEPETTETASLTIYPVNANLISGKLGGWAGEFLAEQGFEVEVWAWSEEKLNAILASGDLPDIMFIPSANVSVIQELANNGQIVNFDDYMDKLPNIANNEKVQVATDYSRQFVTDTGALYGMPLQVGQTTIQTNTERNALKLNWEVYEEIGAPAIESEEDLINVLKQMKEAYPQTEDGSETYALHLFNSMDGSYFYGMFGYYAINGCNYDRLGDFIEVDDVEQTLNYVLEDDSVYKEGLAFYNKLYREGLMDPDSINTDRGSQHTKIEAGGSLAGWAGVPGWEAAGYYPVFMSGVETTFDTKGNVYGNGEYVVVNAKSENLDAALAYVNMMADEDALITLGNGPQGELWDIAEDGSIVMTDKGINWFVNAETATLESGEEYALLNTPWILATAETNETYQVPVRLEFIDEILAAKADSELNKQWQDTTGYENYAELIKAEGTLVEPYTKNVDKFLRQLTDSEMLIQAAAKDIIVNGSWQMVYAESDADFEAIWDEMVKECEELGLPAFYETRLADYEDALAVRDSFEK